MRKTVGALSVEVRPNPLTLRITNRAGALIQEIVFESDGTLSFRLDEHPVLGLGEGGPLPEKDRPWREQPVQFDRRGRLDTMQPRWQADMYGSRNPVAMLLGTGGWGLFVAAPWGQVDLRKADRGVFIPWRPSDAERVPQNERNQQQALAKGLPPPDAVVPGLFDVFVFDAADPAAALKDFSVITGPAAMPPLWALGYMQSHRTLEDDAQMLGIAETFRRKQIPLDALIYLGTGFTPRGWNTKQPSFDFNPDVFKRDPAAVIADLHAQHVKVAVHMVPWDRDRLPTLQGTIPPRAGRNARRLAPRDLLAAARAAGEGGDRRLLARRRRLVQPARAHQAPSALLPGPSADDAQRPAVEPSAQRLPGHCAVGRVGLVGRHRQLMEDARSADRRRHQLLPQHRSLLGIGHRRLLSQQRADGRALRPLVPVRRVLRIVPLAWPHVVDAAALGMGLSDMGPRENNNTNAPIPPDDPRNILQSEMNNPAIEPVARKYAELRYQLLPYTYTLAWEARDRGLPLMRAMWLHYPDDLRARGLGTQFMWGRDLLVAPVFTKGATSREVYLPDGDWYDWWTNEKTKGGVTVTRAVDLATMPLYVRAGAIVPFDPVRQYTSQPVTEPTTLKVYTGADGQYTLYADDGISQEYVAARGTWIRMTWNDRARQLSLEPGAPKGATNLATKRTFRVLLLPAGTTKDVAYDGTKVTLRF